MGIHRAEAGGITGGERYFWSTEECSCFSLKLSVYFYTGTRKAPGSSPVPQRLQQSHSDRAPSQTPAPNRAGKEGHTWARACTSVQIKNVQGTSPCWQQLPWGVPPGAPRVLAEPTEQREGTETQGDRTKRGPLTSRWVRKCNYPCQKERQLQFHFENQIPPYRTGYCPLRPEGRKKESKIVTGGKKPSTTLNFAEF